MTACVASGVTSSGVKPVPPVVRIEPDAGLHVPAQCGLDRAWSSVTVSWATTSAPASVAAAASASPEVSCVRPAATEVEIVSTAVCMGPRA